jgi:hypothetical protein
MIGGERPPTFVLAALCSNSDAFNRRDGEATWRRYLALLKNRDMS